MLKLELNFAPAPSKLSLTGSRGCRGEAGTRWIDADDLQGQVWGNSEMGQNTVAFW